jgi:hypothetical protein
VNYFNGIYHNLFMDGATSYVECYSDGYLNYTSPSPSSEGNYYETLPANVYDNDLDNWADAIFWYPEGLPLNQSTSTHWIGACADWAPAKIGGTPSGFCQITGNASSIYFGLVAPGVDTGSTNQVLNVTNNGSINLVNLQIRANNTALYPLTAPLYWVSNMMWDGASFTYPAANAFTDAFVNTGFTPVAKESNDLFFGIKFQANATEPQYYSTIEIKGLCP